MYYTTYFVGIISSTPEGSQGCSAGDSGGAKSDSAGGRSSGGLGSLIRSEVLRFGSGDHSRALTVPEHTQRGTVQYIGVVRYAFCCRAVQPASCLLVCV